MFIKHMHQLLAVLLMGLFVQGYSQTVPDYIDFAGMKLHLTKQAKTRIQADVDMIKKSPTYFQQKVDRANLYFPIIEKVFREEGFPEEFKYLALQESSLVSDAVSSSNAVGYWQFKKESAVEVGLRVDHLIDERMNIFASSRGASKYLRRNQAALNNWIYTLLSYNLGLGGVKPHVNAEYVGATMMDIDDNMHWYVFRFLAHKIAYENAVGNAFHSSLHLVGYQVNEPKSLYQIAKETTLSEELVLDYNKWCLKKELPGDRTYTVVLPVALQVKEEYIAKYESQSTQIPQQSNPDNVLTSADKKPDKYPSIDHIDDWTAAPVWVTINRVKAVRASKGDDIQSVIMKAGVTKEGFLRFNEINYGHQLIEGNYYYLQLKRTKAVVAFHVVKENETVWSIAQHYGITMNSILSKNRMSKNEYLKTGRVLWLRSKRPKETPIEYKKVSAPVVAVVKDSLANGKKTDTLVSSVQTIRLDENYIYHLVKPGETVFGISRQYKISSDSILYWNNLPGYAIKTDQYLIVGKKQSKVKHLVQQGDTLYKIAQQYGVPMDQILKNNNKSEPALRIGEELIIQ